MENKMLTEIEMVNSNTTRDCIITWEFLYSKNANCTFDDVVDGLCGKLNSRSDNAGVQRILRRLESVGAIDIEQPRTINGKWSTTKFSIKARPIIRKVKSKYKSTCIICGSEFSKLSKSVHMDLCGICTVKKYMTSPEVECAHCHEKLQKNTARGYMHNYYHKNCYVIVLREKRFERLQANDQKKMCACGKKKDNAKQKLCSECKEFKKINKTKENMKTCKICKIKYIGSLCSNDNCIAKEYCKNNVLFKGVHLNATERNKFIKAKIIGLKCEICGYDAVLQYHHVIFKENGGTDELNNIIALCPNHHQEVHKLGLDISEYHKQVLQRIEDIKNGIIIIE